MNSVRRIKSINFSVAALNEPALMRLPKGTLPFDPLMILSMLALMLTGFVMISSASMDVAADNFGGPFFFIFRHGFFVVLA